MSNEDTHDQLMRLFREYFKENQAWESRRTHVSAVKCRNLLAEIRIVARKRRAEIQANRKEIRYKGSELKTESNRRKAEIKKAKQVDVVVLPESTNNGTS
jgi:hypothetical protein